MLILILFYFATPVSSQDTRLNNSTFGLSENTKARLAFVENSYNFYSIIESTTISHSFSFTNISEVPLKIYSVRGNCGCTVANWPHDSIMPGESSSITVTFDSKHKRGNRKQGVDIFANTEPAKTSIYLVGKVIPKKDANLSKTDLSEHENLTVPKPDCINFYPNPTSKYLNLEIDKSKWGKSAIVKIYTSQGIFTLEHKINSISRLVELDVSQLVDGNYFATINIDQNIVESTCFVVMH